MLKEFKDFAMRGNLIDVAVGLVIAGAFGMVTSAFVDGIFMPIVGQIFQLGDLNSAKYVLSAAITDPATGEITKPEAAILYGKLFGAIINFIIVAFVMFMIIKGMNNLKKKEEAAPAPPAGPSQEELLTEIRDLLKK
ncbi:MAG: large conductance mechanosensitive channel protein MscL [Saprospiraceae bacterium]|nr:large conductance mechanosensitive channel protein MscL [Saprospiraceae bacterium]MCB9308598.1 large conductance mechanosensitive channel protein MscL [Lewinellaceae bacterium]